MCVHNVASSAFVMPGYALIAGGKLLLKVFGLHTHPSSLL